MYAVAGIYLGQADGLPIVGAIGNAWLWFALAAWALTLIAMVVHLVRTVLLLGRRPTLVRPQNPAAGPDSGLPPRPARRT
jgi:tellurite resistance protein TehA-like permease